MSKEELLFCPLGGSGEIGGNMNLYAYGKEDNRINEPGKFTKGFTERKSDQSWAKEFKF